MSHFEAFILGLIQGITEFLPVSSDGHLELARVVLGLENEENLSYIVLLHGATVLSILVVFFSEIFKLLQGFFKFQWNDETQYLSKIAVSMIPVLIVGVFMKDFVDSLFTGSLIITGFGLLVTGSFLALTYKIKPREREISFLDSFFIGIAQALAVLPGVSRSGSTISTGLMLGNKKEKLANFSFLMVLVPIIGANMLDMMDGNFSASVANIGTGNIIIGFITAFVTGLIACKWMISMVKKGKLIWFSIYCFIVGLVSISIGFIK